MTTRADGLTTGPQDPVVGTPPRRPGSIRRTTSLDQCWAAEGGAVVTGVGRDLHTTVEGTAVVVDAVGLDAIVSPLGIVTELRSQPEVPELAELAGGPVKKGLRLRLDRLVPRHVAAGSLLHQLADDLPMADLIASYGASREVPEFRLPLEAAERLADLCAGWEREGTMLFHLGQTGIFPIPVGPPAPALEDEQDPLAWPTLPELAPRSVRRRRRLDVAPREDGGFDVDVHFRDSHLGAEGPEDVLHEYTLEVVVGADLVVVASEGRARTLPWPECPGAIGSAARIVGRPVTDLRPLVAQSFTGTTTCTHLNDTLRSVAGVAALVRSLR